MDEFARLAPADRLIYFQEAAARLGIGAPIIEKDFWVCWTLRRLFAIDEFRGHLTFKGGTSLSKVYKVIERFSEDVDVSIERSFLGFGGQMEPEQAPSGKEQRRRIEGLAAACREVIANRLTPQLRGIIEAELGNQQAWSLQADPFDSDQQTLLVQYPAVLAAGLNPYFAPSVKIELGARSDHFPVEDALITPYVHDAIPESCSDSTVRLRVLSVERTFWEKATILHSLHHYPESKKLPPRMSRHYYDVYRLSQSPILERALNAVELLRRVAQHKSVYFKAIWANYAEAVPGTLRLIPADAILHSLRRDYDDMQPMFFGEAPSFDDILAHLPTLEDRVNARET